MTKKLIAMMMALCMLLGMATTAMADDAEPFVINVCIASEPETIDPSLVSSVDGSTYTEHQFEALMRYEMTDELVGDDDSLYAATATYGQAASHTVDDTMTEYTFVLRDDIFWSDGEPVTAHDFVYAWQRLVDPATASDYGYLLDNIVLNAAAIQAGEKDKTELGIVATDDKTLVITLEAPCAYFLELCAFPNLSPLREDVVEGNATWTDPSTIVVNGPYIVTEWVHDSYIKMVPNEYYYNFELLGPDEIIWNLSSSETAILAAYQGGEWDFVESFPTDMIASLQESGDCFIVDYVGTYYLYLNCLKIEDWRVRAAMCLAVDGENLVTNVTQAGQVPATGLVASGIPDSQGNNFAFFKSELGALYTWLQEQYPDYDLSTYTGRCELAMALYQEAVDEGAWDPSTTVVYNFNTSDTHKVIAEAIGSDWMTVLGMSISLENQEWNTYTNGLAESTFGVARLGWIADYMDPITYLELMTTGNAYNYGVWESPEFDQMIVDAKGMVASVERDEVLYNAEALMFSEGGFPVAPLYFYTNVYCMNDKIDNVAYTSLGKFYFMYATPAAAE